MKDSNEGKIIFFDGVCNLCNSSVQFIIKRDPQGVFKFAALQSVEAASLLNESQIDLKELDSIVLLDGEGVHQNSTAALRIARSLSFPWSLFGLFLILPGFLRDPIYRFIAANRYRWFGRQDQCMIPGPELKSRFLQP